MFHFNLHSAVTECILIDNKRSYTTTGKGQTYHRGPVNQSVKKLQQPKGNQVPTDVVPDRRRGGKGSSRRRGREKLCGLSRLLKRTRLCRGITSTREGGRKNLWIDGAIRRDGDRVTPSRFGMGPCFGSTKVDWDFEYIDSMHHYQRGAMTSGM